MASMSDGRVRLNLEVPALVKEQMERLQERSLSSSLTEVVRKSLALYNLFSDHCEGGGKIKLVHADGSEELLRIL